jgi:hypothetical protein
MDEVTILNKILDFGKGWEIKDVKINNISKEIDRWIQLINANALLLFSFCKYTSFGELY